MNLDNLEERQDLLSQINLETTTGKKEKGFLMSKRIYLIIFILNILFYP